MEARDQCAITATRRLDQFIGREFDRGLKTEGGLQFLERGGHHDASEDRGSRRVIDPPDADIVLRQLVPDGQKKAGRDADRLNLDPVERLGYLGFPASFEAVAIDFLPECVPKFELGRASCRKRVCSYG